MKTTRFAVHVLGLVLTMLGWLKMDIEGSERKFFQNETLFMRRVKTFLIEWHKCKVSLDEIVGLLSVQGFALKKIPYQHEVAGTAIFIKK
jgi:hypothetical protein